jgi:hypothetical protein
MTGSFLLTALVIVVTPGTGALFTTAAGLARGTRAGVLAAFACTLGIVPHMVAAITGLAAILYASGVAFETVKFLGVGYLLWMAWRTWREEGVLVLDDRPRHASWRGVLMSGITVNLLNPKLTVFVYGACAAAPLCCGRGCWRAPVWSPGSARCSRRRSRASACGLPRSRASRARAQRRRRTAVTRPRIVASSPGIGA